jgi:predicted amidohydrolase
LKLACIQCNVAFGDPSANAQFAIERIAQLKSQGIDLAIFPEAFLTGYCVESLDQARAIAIPPDHDSIKRIVKASAEHSMHIVMGFAGVENSTLYNGAVLIEPNGTQNLYRKSHLPELGYDKFAKPGDELPVFDTAIGRIGIAICYDLRPPEPIRILALKGADLIVLPTNWPEGADFAPDHMAAVRANENRVFLAACDRIGTENGFRFIGKSGVWDTTGKQLANSGDSEKTLITEIDLEQAKVKRIRIIPDRYEITVFESRRPEIYDTLTDTTR